MQQTGFFFSMESRVLIRIAEGKSILVISGKHGEPGRPDKSERLKLDDANGVFVTHAKNLKNEVKSISKGFDPKEGFIGFIRCN